MEDGFFSKESEFNFRKDKLQTPLKLS